MNITVTLFGQIAAFILLIWFVNKVLWGPLNNLLGERQKKIADGLAAAEKGRHELELSEKPGHRLPRYWRKQKNAPPRLLKKQKTMRVTKVIA